MNNSVEEKKLAELLVELGASKTQIITLPGGETLAVRVGQQIQSLENYLPPKRIERTVTLLEAGSFVDYVNRFKNPNTLIFACVSETGVSFKAMLDYHAGAPELKPDYCRHVAVFTAIETPEWKVWQAADRELMAQAEFATWLEDNLSLFTVGGENKYPAGADLLELVKSLEGHRNARFAQSIRLDNGAHSVQYDEDIVIRGGGTSTQAGTLEVPPMICGGLAIFQGADPYEMPARLKTRCVDRKLGLIFETVNLPKIIRESILLLVKKVADGTQIVPLLGNL